MSPEPVQQYSDYPHNEASTVRRLHTPSPPSPPADDDLTPEDEAPRVAATRRDVSRATNTRFIIGGVALGALILGTIGYETYPRPSAPAGGQEAGMTGTPNDRQVASATRSSAGPVAASPTHAPQPARPTATGTDLNAMLAYGPKSQTAPQPAPAPTQPPKAREPDNGAAPAPQSAVPAMTASAAPVAQHPADPSRDAARLTAAPMATQDQVDVLQLVTMEATLVQQDRAEVAALRAQLQHDRQAAIQHDADMNRRLAMLEARKAVSDAAEAPQHARDDAALAAKRALAAAMGTSSAQPPESRAGSGTSAQSAQDAAPQPASAVRSWVPRYRIVSASPLLAMVEDDNAPAGQPAQFEVQVGANLRGYGVVQSIYQSGTNWVIKTDHGQIL